MRSAKPAETLEGTEAQRRTRMNILYNERPSQSDNPNGVNQLSMASCIQLDPW